ncbi:RNA-directed DNA polymerase [Jannaschia sp. R86511]|uniref:RNA-directed DNA polymerase n=1 Tax=Jannaschia sp. R86511 TaxID=3093853 RepID=UPI0036D3EC26
MRYIHGVDRRSGIAVSRMPGGSVTLRTDISSFYSSIYTHAIDWAVHGKAAAKRAMRSSSRTTGQLLDAYVRESRNGQTIGVSVGPDTSLLVSELVLARVDEALCREFPRLSSRAFRFVDDMVFYASSTAEAYEVLGRYEQILRDFGLSLNPNKVAVEDGIRPIDSAWVPVLRQARFRDDTDVHQTQDLIDLFTLAFDQAQKFPTDGVLSYAIKRSDPFPGGATSWPTYRDLVVASISQEPSVLRNAHQVLTFAKAHGLKVDADRLVSVLNETCQEHARLDHGFEVSWILTILRDLDLPLDATVGQSIADMDDNASLVLLVDETKRRPITLSSVDLGQAVKRAERPGALSSEDWLLAYELRAAKDCRPAKWDGSTEWKKLNSAKVRFLVPRASRLSGRFRRRLPSFLTGWGY